MRWPAIIGSLGPSPADKTRSVDASTWRAIPNGGVEHVARRLPAPDPRRTGPRRYSEVTFVVPKVSTKDACSAVSTARTQ
jgi:hypothetical protein